MTFRLTISFLLLILIHGLLAQKPSNGFQEKVVDAILYEDAEKVGLPENEIERHLISSIISRNSSPEVSAEKLIAAKQAILVNKKEAYYPFLHLVEGYFYMFEDVPMAESLFLKSVEVFENREDQTMSFLTQYFLVRILAISDQWNAALEAYLKYQKSFEEAFEVNTLASKKIDLLGKNLHGTILTAVSNIDSSAVPKAEVFLRQGKR